MRERQYFVQSRRRIRQYCYAKGYPKIFHFRIDEKLEQMVLDKELSFEALGYYAFRRSLYATYIPRESRILEKLNITARQSKRLKRECRDAGVMLVAQHDMQTFTATLQSCIPRTMHRQIEDGYTMQMRRAYDAQRGSGRPFIDTMSPYVGRIIGSPALCKMLVLRPTVYGGCCIHQPDTRGMERLKAMGLWILLSNARMSHNWKHPTNIARHFGISHPTAIKLCKHLRTLGLLYHLPDEQKIGVSMVLWDQPAHNLLHPLRIDRMHEPWKQLLQHGITG